ncbi:MAG TPA: hypothetical protein DFR83_27585 [Deltaproteobacteria bacterium]|nr:hypothetical protein [Deltaproteobacteria bacterium]
MGTHGLDAHFVAPQPPLFHPFPERLRGHTMAMIPSVVSTVPTLTASTSGHLGSTTAVEQAPVQPRGQIGVEVAARLRAGMEGIVQSTDAAGRLVDPGPAAVGRFAAARRTTAPTTKNSDGSEQADARDKESVIELFADARPDAGASPIVGRLSGGLTRAGSLAQSADEDRVGRFMPRILPRARRAGIDAQPSAMREAFSAGIGRFESTVGRLSGALSR